MQHCTALHTSVFHSLEEQIAVIDLTGKILDVNQAWQQFGIENGFSPDHVWIGCNYLDTLSHSASAGDNLAHEALQGILDVFSGKRTVVYLEYPCHSPDTQRWFTMRVTPLHGDGSRTLFLISHHNITQRKLAEEQVRLLAMQDPLTGLANRRAFEQFLHREMRHSTRHQRPISLVLVDVDYFKHYNDALGHAAGDQCLSDIGRVLQNHARRPGDLAARIGGDEFTLILGNTHQAIAQQIAASVLKAIHNLQLVFGLSRQVTVSVGLACVVPQARHNVDFLFREADKALYQAKSAGRNQVVQAPFNPNQPH